tara:strand:+ start:634 stop:900 length:267 start_codon:yes stop_codon:yes gene_type:complete
MKPTTRTNAVSNLKLEAIEKDDFLGVRITKWQGRSEAPEVVELVGEAELKELRDFMIDFSIHAESIIRDAKMRTESLRLSVERLSDVL